MSQQQLTPFDLQAYISRYEPRSETSLQRLLFLAHHFHEQRGNLLVVGGDSSSSAAATDAEAVTKQSFELAVDRMKDSGNHRRYLEEFGAIDATPGTPAAEGDGVDAPELSGTPMRPRSDSHAVSSPHPSHPPKHIIQHYMEYNRTFVDNSKRDAQHRLETMEGRLATAQSHLMKESIRSALLALAEFHKERGELREAWRRVARSR